MSHWTGGGIIRFAFREDPRSCREKGLEKAGLRGGPLGHKTPIREPCSGSQRKPAEAHSLFAGWCLHLGIT